MGVDRCAQCSKCGSDLAESPDGHAPPEPHRMVQEPVKATTDDGEKTVGFITTCKWCGRTATDIAARGEPMMTS